MIFKSDFFHRGKRLHGSVHKHWTLSPLRINLQHDFMSRKCLPCVAQDSCQGTGSNPFLFAPGFVLIGKDRVAPRLMTLVKDNFTIRIAHGSLNDLNRLTAVPGTLCKTGKVSEIRQLWLV